MKKKIWIPIIIIVLLAVLFVPIPSGVMKDGDQVVWILLHLRQPVDDKFIGFMFIQTKLCKCIFKECGGILARNAKAL